MLSFLKNIFTNFVACVPRFGWMVSACKHQVTWSKTWTPNIFSMVSMNDLQCGFIEIGSLAKRERSSGIIHRAFAKTFF